MGRFPPLAAGLFHRGGLRGGGPADCWGRNDSGQADDQVGPFAPYTPVTDMVAPTASPSVGAGSSLDGWNTADVTVDWNWADAGSGLDTGACTAQSTSEGEGDAVEVSATCTDLADNEGSASVSLKIDTTAPTVTCAASPTFLVGSTPTTGLSATVTDELSGPAASPVTTAVTAGDVAAAGVFTAPLTGADVAGNPTTVDCGYIAAYEFRGFTQPTQNVSVKRGSAIQVKFALADADGVLSDAEAAALISPTCQVFVTFDGQVTGCAQYNATTDTFQLGVKTTKSLTTGTHTVGIRVTSTTGDIVTTATTEVILR